MIGKRFLAIVKSEREPDCISKVEVLSVFEEVYFDEENYFASVEDEFNNPALIMNNQSKFVSVLTFDLETFQIHRVHEVNLLSYISGLSSEKVQQLIDNAYAEIKQRLDKTKEVNKEFNVIEQDIDNHIQKLENLGYTNEELGDRLQEFLDDKYPNLSLRTGTKNKD